MAPDSPQLVSSLPSQCLFVLPLVEGPSVKEEDALNQYSNLLPHKHNETSSAYSRKGLNVTAANTFELSYDMKVTEYFVLL